MNSDQREIESPKLEMDVPPSSIDIEPDDLCDLSPKARLDWLKWLKNFSLIRIILTLMFVLYLTNIAIAVWAPDVTIVLQEPLFETLKVLLFMVAGVVLAKIEEQQD